MPRETSIFADTLDPAIVDAVDLDPKTVLLDALGGSGFSSTFRLMAWRRTGNGRETFFVKTRSGADAAAMFAGEYASLNVIANTVPGFCPRAYAHGALRDQPGVHFLVTDFLLFVRCPPDRMAPSLATRLAALHITEMPPARSGAPADRPFGFPVPTCCGATEQDNTWTASWADFFANHRLRHVLCMGQRAHGAADSALADAVERTAATVVPRLLGDGHLQRAAARGGGAIVPVVVHGDLWSGNSRFAQLSSSSSSSSSSKRASVVVYDPACVYGHSEYELGIMHMFGGFDYLWSEYTALVPKDEPVSEWEDRLKLYELYHHLNHWVLFGSSYRNGAMSIMQKLLEKYG